ncbi:hypothetical protein IJI91_03115 [Candidatus Saccharibacteria bacterium]|nr:hypothetical protein [Candidatus Saccharibacteria bacterium]
MKIKNKLFLTIFLMVIGVIIMMAVMTINNVSGETEQMRGEGWMKNGDASKYLQNN